MGKTLKSKDFKVFSYPKVGNSLYSLFAPVRLIFDGNFENQEVRYYEENQVELRRPHGGNLCRFPHFPQSKGLADKTLQSYEQQFRSLDEMVKQNVLLDICHFRAPFLHNFKLESLIFLTF